MGQNLVYTRYSKTSLCSFILDYRFDYLNLHWASPLDITDISTSKVKNGIISFQNLYFLLLYFVFTSSMSIITLFPLLSSLLQHLPGSD